MVLWSFKHDPIYKRSRVQTCVLDMFSISTCCTLACHAFEVLIESLSIRHLVQWFYYFLLTFSPVHIYHYCEVWVSFNNSYSAEHVSSERYWLELWILYSWCMEGMQAYDIQTTIGSGDDNHDHCSHIYNAWHINLIHGNTVKKPTLLSQRSIGSWSRSIVIVTIMEVQLSFQL